MATKHDVNFRADGDVEIKFETDGRNDCLKIKSRRQELHVALTPEQGSKLVSLFQSKSDDDKPPRTTKKKASKKKKSTKKKASKK